VTDKGRPHLARILTATERMGKLIDVLLEFSRIGRAELTRTLVPLEHIVADARRELLADTDGRRVIWQIGALPSVQGDPTLLRQVFINLLSNALKYSRPRDVARIEIGHQPGDDGQVVVFVRDNGVGFNMQYVARLFTVFKRLHHADEFEGVGVGLANVRRIVQRHGGRVWAEGGVDAGATFYISLPLAPAAHHQSVGREQVAYPARSAAAVASEG
jgi:light-regulated signal transduction histidine kinase (bacteriophytochrome)